VKGVGVAHLYNRVCPTTSEADGYKPTLPIYNLPVRVLQEQKPRFMKNLFFIGCLFIITAFSNKPLYVQIYETEGVNISKTKDYYTYENDTVRIDYVFWADGGVMAFRVFNKTNRPLYIDWFKSAYISNAGRYQYWNERNKPEVSREGISRRNKIIFPSVPGYTGSVIADRIKPEKISFIPPGSYLEKNGDYLTEDFFTDWGTDYSQTKEPRHDDPHIITTVSCKKFTRENTPLDFRNFLTLSFSDNFTSEFYVNNEFYVKSITSMERNHFWDDIADSHVNDNADWRSFKNNYYSQTKYKKGADFYYQTYKKGYQ
jgi:hypothetical protein